MLLNSRASWSQRGLAFFVVNIPGSSTFWLPGLLLLYVHVGIIYWLAAFDQPLHRRSNQTKMPGRIRCCCLCSILYLWCAFVSVRACGQQRKWRTHTLPLPTQPKEIKVACDRIMHCFLSKFNRHQAWLCWRNTLSDLAHEKTTRKLTSGTENPQLLWSSCGTPNNCEVLHWCLQRLPYMTLSIAQREKAWGQKTFPEVHVCVCSCMSVSMCKADSDQNQLLQRIAADLWWT